MAERTHARRTPGKQISGTGRFEATVRPGRGKQNLADLDSVPLDRMPDARGRLRALVTADEIVTLLDLGYEVSLHRHLAIQPMAAELIATDESVRRTLEHRFAPVRPALPPARATTKRKR